jgi:hypothetical protein
MLDLVGRGERIRTSDLTVPNRALYQAEPRPDVFYRRSIPTDFRKLVPKASEPCNSAAETLADNREGR